MKGKIILFVLVILAVFVLFGCTQPSAESVSTFAKCIKDSGAKFYGTFWCPHCIEQKKLFGSSVEYLPYVECSTPDGKSELQVCIDAGIESYPTWVFADGSTAVGLQTFAQLSTKTGCKLS
ncbi:MAG: hypothetical protein WCW13_04445 [archaeon]|jgi:hypothetical protein